MKHQKFPLGWGQLPKRATKTGFLRVWLLLAFVIVGSRLGAIPYVIGDCVVDIEIRNTAMIPILQRWVSVKERNGNILVFARADGYVTKKVEITKADGQKFHKLDLTLEDEPRHILVRDVCGTPIASAYVDKSQFGFPSDVYGITIGIPKQLLPHPNPKMIQVMSDLIWVPITKSCKIEEIEGFQKITLTVDRGDYAATQRLISVVVAIQPSSIEDSEPDEGNEEDEGDIGSDTPGIWLGRLHAIEAVEAIRPSSYPHDGVYAAKKPWMAHVPEIARMARVSRASSPVSMPPTMQAGPGSSQALAELLAGAYSPACLEAAMASSGFPSETLKQLLAHKESFRVLHRD